MRKALGRSTSQRAIGLCGLLACAASLALAQGKPIPQLAKKGDKFTFMVDGKPFIMLGRPGGQLQRATRIAWSAPGRLPGHEPEHRRVSRSTGTSSSRRRASSTSPVSTRSSRGLRAQGLRAVLLWFGTWKNGAMDWSPNWVKADPRRFPRVLDCGGKPIRVLSPHSRANLEADKKAYIAMMKHLREMDEADRTVIMVQVENEPGSLGSVRDFSPESNKLFAGAAPAKLVAALKKKPGTWKEVFGREADEAFNAYYVSGLHQRSGAGRKAESIRCRPMSTCGTAATAPTTTGSASTVPARSYPSGGAVAHMLDLWKANAPGHRRDRIGHLPPVAHHLPEDSEQLHGGRTTRC